MPPKFFHLRDWYIIVPLGLLAALLGAWGFSRCDLHHGNVSIVTDTLSLLLLRGNPEKCSAGEWQIAAAQVLLPLSVILAGAKLYLINLGRDYRIARARHARNHVIVCGLGETGKQIVKNLRADGRRVVAVSKNAEDATDLLCDTLSVPVLNADAAQNSVLRQAGLKNASTIILATGSDAQNLDIGVRIAKAVEGRRRTALRILVELRQGWLSERLSNHDRATLSNPAAHLEFFNLTNNAARQLLLSRAFRRTFLTNPRPKSPHILLLGLNAVGVEIVRKAISTPFALPDVRPKFTIVTDDAGSAEAFAQSSPGLRAVADIAFVPSRDAYGAPYDAEKAAGFLKALSPHAVVVALSGDEENLDRALGLRSALDGLDRHVVPLFVQLRDQHKLGTFLREMESYSSLLPDRFVPFGDLENLTTPQHLLNEVQDAVARAIHEDYRRKNRLASTDVGSVPWQNLPERLKTSNREAADHVYAALSFGGFRARSAGRFHHIALGPADIEEMAIATHCRWIRERKIRGWSYAAKRNDRLKQHPDLRDWADLNDRAKEKDRDVVRGFQKLLRFSDEAIVEENIIDLAEHHATAKERMKPGALNVLIVNPQVDAHWTVVKSIEETGSLSLRLIWRGSANLKYLLDSEDIQSEFYLVDGWIF